MIRINLFTIIAVFLTVALGIGGFFLFSGPDVRDDNIALSPEDIPSPKGNIISGDTIPGTQISDSEPPSTPERPSGIPSDTQVILSWPASTDNTAVSGYKIYSNNKLVGSVKGLKTAVIGLQPLTGYSFRIVAFDNSGNQSLSSPALTIRTLARPAPATQPTSMPNPTLSPAPSATQIPTPTPAPTPASTPAPTPTPAQTPVSDGQTYTVNVTQNSISPSSLSIVRGDTVIFRWLSGDEVELIFSPTPPSTIKLDHDTIQKSYKFTAAGTYSYRVREGNGTATITVNQ